MTHLRPGADRQRRPRHLADAFWAYYLESNPTEAHLLGDYRYAAFFEDATPRGRGPPDRGACAPSPPTPRRSSPGGLSEQEKVTRLVLESTATATADRLQTRLAELHADPIFGPQVELPIIAPMLSLPDATVAEALVDKLHGAARWLTEQGERLREGLAAGRVSPAFAVEGAIAQLEEQLAAPLADDAVLASLPAAPAGVDEAAWRDRLAQAVESRAAPGHGVLPRRAAATRGAAAPARRQGRPVLARGRRGVVRRDAALLHDHHDERPGDPRPRARRRWPSSPTSTARSAPRSSAPTTSAQIFEAMRTDPKLHFERSEQLVEASEVAMARAWDAMPDVVRGAAAGAVRGQGDGVGRQGLLLPAGRRRLARRHVLHQHRRPGARGAPSSSSRWPSTRASPATTCS